MKEYRFFPRAQDQADLLRQIGKPAGSIVLRRGEDGAWRFDTDTVARLPALYAQLRDRPVVAGSDIVTLEEWLQRRMPASLARTGFLGVRSWQWLAILLVILLGLVADLAVRTALRGVSARIVRNIDGEDPEQLRATLRPIGLFAATLVWLVPLRFVEFQPTVELVLASTLRIVLVLSGTLSGWRVIDLAATVLSARAAATSSRVDDILVPLLSRAFKIFVLAMGLIYAADALDIPIGPLLASFTLAGVGFSFAAKDTVENFFGSIAVVLDRPFDIGDWVLIDDTEGIVEQVGFRSTRIRTFYNSQVTVPNSNLVRATVDNYGRRRYRRWKTTLGLQYDTTPDALVAFTEGIRELVRSHPWTRKDYYQVWCNDFGASSLDVLVYVFFEVPDWSTELRERERLFVDIVRLADQLGVQFAFPTQTLHVFPGEAPGDPAELPGRNSEAAALRDGVRAARNVVRNQGWQGRPPPPVVLPDSPTQEERDAAGNPIEADETEVETASEPDSDSRTASDPGVDEEPDGDDRPA